ncbi:unnamed protein product, partial [Aphanomyces euteiches]
DGEKRQDKHRDAYFVELENGFYIDACRFGNIARFINHSHRPNAFFDIWFVGGYPRVAIRAKRNIKVNEEITVNYGKAYPMAKCLCDFCKKRRKGTSG